MPRHRRQRRRRGGGGEGRSLPGMSTLPLLLLICIIASPLSASAGAGAGRRSSSSPDASSGLWRATALGRSKHLSASRWISTSSSPSGPSSSKGGKPDEGRFWGGVLGWLGSPALSSNPSCAAPGGGDGCPVRLSRSWSRALFAASCVNPAVAVLLNDYHAAPWPLVRISKDTTAAFRMIYNGVFSFLRLKPRLLFVVGSCLRALQLSTSLSRLIDPGVGVGLGLNLAALVCYARWPAPLVLGWAASRAFWDFLGAEPPRGGHVPITVHLSDPRDKVEERRRERYLFGLF